MRVKGLILSAAILLLVAVTGCSLSGQDTPNNAPNNDVAPREAKEAEKEEAASGPEDTTLKLTVPKMERIQEVIVPDAAGNDEERLTNYHAIHLTGTGFPWQKEANVYIAGHRLGYSGTASYLAFYDLDKLENGDEILVEDSEGKEYTYRVFNEFVVAPTALEVTEPIKGKNILTLQSCTLPDYSERLIVQAEKVS